MAIAAQLKKMSSQIIDLIAENQILTTNVTKLTMNNSLLVESEHELVKRNIANQKIVKMLADKLNDSYEMLEFSTESPHHLETHVEQPDQEYDHLNRAYLTTDMREVSLQNIILGNEASSGRLQSVSCKNITNCKRQ
jgi:histidinol dehydrogenase